MNRKISKLLQKGYIAYVAIGIKEDGTVDTEISGYQADLLLEVKKVEQDILNA